MIQNRLRVPEADGKSCLLEGMEPPFPKVVEWNSYLGIS